MPPTPGQTPHPHPARQGSRRTTPLPPGWARIRVRVLQRDRWCCQLHYDGCLRRASEVDHVGEPDDHRDEVLRAVCHPCHATRSGRQGAAVTNGRHAQRRRPPEPHPGLLT